MKDLCNVLEEKAEDYLAGDLSPEEQAVLDEHLAVCPLCRKKLEQVKSLDCDLASLREEPPAALLDGVMAGVRREKKKRALIYLGKLLPMAACLALVVSVVLLFPSIASQQKGENAVPDRLPNGDLIEGEDSDLSPSDKNDAVEIESNAEADEESVVITPTVTDSVLEDRPTPEPPYETDPPTGTRPPASTGLPNANVPVTDAPAIEAPTTDAPAIEAPTTDAPAIEAPTTDAPTVEVPDEEETDASGDGNGSSEYDTAASPETDAEQSPATEGVETQAPSSETEADDETDASAENRGEEPGRTLLGVLFLAIYIALILAAVGVAVLLVLLLIRSRRNRR
ncbi:MAG: zf-HC2 domain-containing protein [Clostridia bacterium]|nr:zf-HC2 domain-containing protein [Clostridia bacterium]